MTKRKKAKAATKSRKASAKRATTPKGKRPDGSISSGIYDQVEKLVADGKMKRSEAFRQIAKESGRKEGTVAVNYYYVAKKRGKAGRRAVKKTAAKPAAKTAKAGSISGMIYDAIEKLIAGGAMTRAAAFRQHAKQTGRKEGTVAVNYYYAEKRSLVCPTFVSRGEGCGNEDRRARVPLLLEHVGSSRACFRCSRRLRRRFADRRWSLARLRRANRPVCWDS